MDWTRYYRRHHRGIIYCIPLLLAIIYIYMSSVGTNVNVNMTTQRNRYVFGLIGAPCVSSVPSTNVANKLVARISLDPDSQGKSPEERAASHLAGVKCDIDTMRRFFGRGQDVSELFCYNHVDAQGKDWLLKKLRLAFAMTNVRTFFVYYSGHGIEDNGAWYLGDGTLAPDELFQLWQESLSGQSGESVLVIISDSCFSGKWVEAANQAQLSSVAVQSATDQFNPSYDNAETGGVFTYKVYNRGRAAFQSVFSVTGFFTTIPFALWMLGKEAVALFQTKRDELFPQKYVPDRFSQIMSRRGGTIQPSKIINNGRFLFVDTFEWLMFR